jgi:outer membrane lipoprotein-sorting protein
MMRMVILYRMKNLVTLCAALAAVSSFALAKDAAADNSCVSPVIETAAAVETSYGSSYRVETYYRSPQEAAARFITDKPALMVVEGDAVWIRTPEGDLPGGENERRFVIGHQFHALALRFDEIMTGVEKVKNIDFKGGTFKGRKGRYPDGGEATLVADREGRPLGLLLELPDETRIEVSYEDWRDTPSGAAAPYKAVILHNGNLFTYEYESVTFAEGGALAFHDAYPAPAIDAVAAHRSEIAAQCGG